MNILGSHGNHDCKKILAFQWICLPANSNQSYAAVQRLFRKLTNWPRKQCPSRSVTNEKEQMPTSRSISHEWERADAGGLVDQSRTRKSRYRRPGRSVTNKKEQMLASSSIKPEREEGDVLIESRDIKDAVSSIWKDENLNYSRRNLLCSPVNCWVSFFCYFFSLRASRSWPLHVIP
jgi:hypothetical protein